MGVTNYAAQTAIFCMGSDISNRFIQSVEVGYGSGTAMITDTILVNGSVRVIQTGSPNFATPLQVTFQADFTSNQMSGLQLTEFGLFTSGALKIGSAWARESFPAITFDGTNELQIGYTIQASAG